MSKINKLKTLLGAHMSIAGGVQNSIYKGNEIGCNAIQIFTHSNRQWGFKLFNQESIEKFAQAKKETGLTHIISHASYLINLGSKTEEVVQKSIKALQNELERCDQLNIKYTVLHPGTEPIEKIAEGINQVLDNSNTQCMILLENMAGQGRVAGSSFQELADIRNNINKKERIGVCFDTCHAWAEGYDFSDPDKYKQLWLDFDQIIGFEHLKAMHINDSKKALGSHADRHANIGQGTIGLEAFRLIMNDERLINIPKILVTPSENYYDYKKELEILRNLIN